MFQCELCGEDVAEEDCDFCDDCFDALNEAIDELEDNDGSVH